MSALERGRQLLEKGELADAIWALKDALEESPEQPAGYFALMEAYELAYSVFPDPQLLEQVKNVLVGARDQDLTQEEQDRADRIEQRIVAKLKELG